MADIELNPLIDPDGDGDEEGAVGGEEETSFGGDNDAFDPDDYTEEQRPRAKQAISDLERLGLKTSNELIYDIVDGNPCVKLGGVGDDWYEIVEKENKVTLEPRGAYGVNQIEHIERILGIVSEGGDGASRVTTTPSGVFNRRLNELEIAKKFIESKYTGTNFDKVLHGIDEYDRVWVSLNKGGPKKQSVKFTIDENGKLTNITSGSKTKPSKTLLDYLGTRNEDLLTTNDSQIVKNAKKLTALEKELKASKERNDSLNREKKKISDENEKLKGKVTRRDKEITNLQKDLSKATTPEERKKFEKEIRDLKEETQKLQREEKEKIERNEEEIRRLREQIQEDPVNEEELEERIRELEQENERLGERNEEIFSRMSLKDKVKYIFKKYGVTVVGVLAAVGTVIGVIVSNLKSGLSKVAKGVGNGLKELGKKLAEILPGMIGAIVSFLFKTAGEAVSFLAKHAWLLILLVVTFVVEQFKNKKK